MSNNTQITVITQKTGGVSVVAIGRGLQGATGPSGLAARHEHNQSVPSANWVVNHNLGYRPQVQPLSVGGVAMLAEVLHTSVNQALVYFDAPTAGIALCS